MARRTATPQELRDAVRAAEDDLHTSTKALLLYGADWPLRECDPTTIMRSVLVLAQQVLGYHVEVGYHDELLAHHIGIEMVPLLDECPMLDWGRFRPWPQKTWRWLPPGEGSRHLSAVLAPRGTGKSLLGTTVLAIWYALRYRNVRILVTSKTAPAAIRMGRTIRNVLAGNPMLKAMFGDLHGLPWGDTGFNIAGRTRLEGAPTFTMLGTMGQLASVHFNVGFFDDVATLENSRTEARRQQLWEWLYQTALPTVRPVSDIVELPASVHVAGTRYHPADLHAALPRESREWLLCYKRWPALEPSEEWRETNRARIEGWWHEVEESRSRGDAPPPMPEPEGSESLLPESWRSAWEAALPVQELLHMRADWPRQYFDAQYQNDARLLSGRVFKAEDLQWCDEQSYMGDLPGWTGWDLAISTDRRADFTAGVHVRLDKQWKHPGTGQPGRVLIWDAFLDRVDLAGKVSGVLQDQRENQPRGIAIEGTAAQALFLEQPQFAALPVEKALPITDKLSRAAMLVSFAQSGRLFFVRRREPDGRKSAREERMNVLWYQFSEFPDGRAKKDGVDAAAYAVDLLTRSWHGVAQAPALPADEAAKKVLRADYSKVGARPKRR